jgi:signal peptidase I
LIIIKKIKVILFVVAIVSLLLVNVVAISYNSNMEHIDIQPSSWIASNGIYGLHDLKTNDYRLIIPNIPSSIRLMGTLPTRSMLPLISDNAMTMVLELDNKSQINVGDIVVFEYDNHIIGHRVIEKGFDSQGLYFVTKGDHNLRDDISFCGKVRPDCVIGIVVGIIY